jgi:hypothetical protein
MAGKGAWRVGGAAADAARAEQVPGTIEDISVLHAVAEVLAKRWKPE